jgi:hypothetical protein
VQHVLWAVVSDEIKQVIEFFPRRRQAERMVAEGLQDEPDQREVLRVEKVDFRTGFHRHRLGAIQTKGGRGPSWTFVTLDEPSY